jgi:hypothetical protein
MPGDIYWLYLVTRIRLTDFIILAILAPQVAATEKDRARSLPTAQWIFLTMMGRE